MNPNEPDTDDLVILPDGTPARFGYVNPEELRFGAVPTWDEANPVLSEDECEEHDDLAAFTPAVESQQNNNCTAAALAMLAGTAFRAAGVADVPRFSWSFNYAQCNGGRDRGAMCRDVMASAKAGMGHGLLPVAKWSDSNLYLSRGEITPELAEIANQWQFLEVYQCMNWAHVRSALARRFCVYHGFVLGSRFFNTGRDGKVPAWDGRRSNGHAMFSRGLTRRFGDLRAVTVNTWGRSFGDGGVGYIDRSYFWEQSGNYVNLDAFAVRAVKRIDPAPVAT